MKKKGLINSIIAAVFAVLTYISMAFNFVYFSGTVGNTETSTSMSLGDWFDMLGQDIDKIGMYRFARVLMIIALILVVAVAVIAIVNVFLNKKVLNLTLRIVSIVALVVSVLYLVTFIAGGIMISRTTDLLVTTSSVKYLPHVGSVLLGVFAIITSCIGLVNTLKLKKSK